MLYIYGGFRMQLTVWTRKWFCSIEDQAKYSVVLPKVTFLIPIALAVDLLKLLFLVFALLFWSGWWFLLIH